MTKKEEKQEFKIPHFISLESSVGVVCMLASKSQTHRYLFSGEYEWLVLPAIALKQFAIFRNKKNEPVAYVSWAKVNDEVATRLKSGNIKLTPSDWQSGTKTYIIDIISPFVPGKEILKELNNNQLKDEKVRILRPKKDKKGNEAVLLSDALKDQEKEEKKNKKEKK